MNAFLLHLHCVKLMNWSIQITFAVTCQHVNITDMDSGLLMYSTLCALLWQINTDKVSTQTCSLSLTRSLSHTGIKVNVIKGTD